MKNIKLFIGIVITAIILGSCSQHTCPSYSGSVNKQHKNVRR